MVTLRLLAPRTGWAMDRLQGVVVLLAKWFALACIVCLSSCLPSRPPINVWILTEKFSRGLTSSAFYWDVALGC